MADRVISQKKIERLYAQGRMGKDKAYEYLRGSRGFIDEQIKDLDVGYVEYFKIDETFFLKDTVLFPLYDAMGKIRGVNSRKTYEKFFIKIISDSYPLLYTDWEFYKKTLVLTESPICAMTLRPFLPNMSVSATLSASLKSQALTLLSIAPKIITVLDNDDAGRRCSNSIEDYNPKTFHLPTHVYEGFKDPNAMFMDNKDAFESLVNYIKTVDRKTR